MVESNPEYTLTGDLNVIANELSSVIYNCLDQITLLSKTPVKNIGLDQHFLDKYIISLASFALTINRDKVVDFEDPKQLFPLVHYYQNIREIAQIIFHGSILGSVTSSSQELVLLSQVLQSLFERFPTVHKIEKAHHDETLELLAKAHSTQTTSGAAELLVKDYAAGSLSNETLNNVRVAFDVVNDNDLFLQYDFKRYLELTLSNEDESSFFTKTTDSTPVNV